MSKTAKIAAICNQKGGVGKNVTAVNLGIGMARADKWFFLVDVDAQGSLTASLGWLWHLGDAQCTGKLW